MRRRRMPVIELVSIWHNVASGKEIVNALLSTHTFLLNGLQASAQAMQLIDLQVPLRAFQL